MSGRSIRAWREQRRYAKAMANIREWTGVPDNVSDEEILRRLANFGRAVAKQGKTAEAFAADMHRLKVAIDASSQTMGAHMRKAAENFEKTRKSGGTVQAPKERR